MNYLKHPMVMRLLVALMWLVLAFLTVVAYAPPSPRPTTLPDTAFSEARARVFLKELVGDDIPHPVESSQNEIVREHILSTLRGFGYAPEVQTAEVNDQNGFPVTVHNILVRRRGSHPGPAVMLVAHYDSVPPGPGASDDAASVAIILENSRMLRSLPPFRNDLILLITDGEERGLLGAHGFVDAHPWAQDVKVVINLEARGTSGRSLLFQTSDKDAWLIALYARTVHQPTTSSLYAEVYKRLPNDTDFTVFKEHGMEGYNFAFIRDARSYHTARDNLANSDPGSLQHQGDNAWLLLTALADFNLEERTQGRTIYTDVMGQFLLWWPASLNLLLASSIFFVTLAAGTVAYRRGRLQTLSLRTFAFFPLALLGALLLGQLCDLALRSAGLLLGKWIDYPLPIALALGAVALLGICGVARFLLPNKREGWGIWTGVWFWWNALGVLIAWLAPGASYLFLLPGGVAAVLGLLAALLPTSQSETGLLGAAGLGALATSIFWLPLEFLLYDAIGFWLGIVYAACAALLVLTAAPLLFGPSSVALSQAQQGKNSRKQGETE